MKTIRQIHDYFELLTTKVDGLQHFYYIDGGDALPQRLLHYYSNIATDGQPTLILSVYEAPLIPISGSSFYGGFAIQLMVLEKVDLTSADTALVDSRSLTHQLMLKTIGQMQIDRENQAPGTAQWHYTIEQNRLLPETNIANSNAYGWSVDINLETEVNQIMFLDPLS